MLAIIGIGLPGCGKTTILKPLAKVNNLVYINADDIREELTGDPTNHAKDAEVWEELYHRIADGLMGRGVVVDVTNTKLSDRRQMVSFARRNGAKKIEGYFIKAPVETCMERNNKRHRVVPSAALNKMQRRLERNPPSLNEGFDGIEIIDNA